MSYLVCDSYPAGFKGREVNDSDRGAYDYAEGLAEPASEHS